MKSNFKFLGVVLFVLSAIFSGGALVGACLGAPVAGGVISVISSFFPGAPHGSFLEGTPYKEIWTGELIKKFRADTTWLSFIPSRDELVNNNTIHMVDVGADPDVLINNTTYPIPSAQREDDDVAISLYKFETTNTRVTADELYALSFDKIPTVISDHKEVLSEKECSMSAHSLTPNKDTADTPVILTSGPSNGETYARHRATQNDIIKLKKSLDDLKVPKGNRMLVLCNEHIEDLLMVDEKFANQYNNTADGKVLNRWGFQIEEYVDNPRFKVTGGVLTKKAFGAAAEPDVDQACSFFFYIPRSFKCTGTTEMFYSEASKDPEYRQNKVGFRQWQICLPKKTTGFGALVSKIYQAPS